MSIIKVNNDIAFANWEVDEKNHFYCRALLRPDLTKFAINGIYIDFYEKRLLVSFVGSSLIDLQSLFKLTINNAVFFHNDYGIENVKQLVDDFLLRMAKLGVFA